MDAISEKLFSIKNILTSHSVEIAPLICTDGSLTLIGALSRVFNGLTTPLYINWCFDVLVKFAKDTSLLRIRNVVNTRVIIDSVHYLRNFIKQIKKKTTNPILRNSIIFSMTLLQDCTSIAEFDFYLKEIYNLFNNRVIDESVVRSFQVGVFIRNNIKNKCLI
jgi:hypothetical protein